MTLNLVIPMAGRGQRFADAGYTEPKPLLPVHGWPMIRVVLDNLVPTTPCRAILVCLREHLERHDLAAAARGRAEEVVVVPIDAMTAGAAETALLAAPWIDSDEPLMIAMCDQYVDIEIDDYLAAHARSGADGHIMTFRSRDPRWSYCRLDADGRVREIAEKRVISSDATVGIYNFRRGRDFVRATRRMIAADRRVRGEFYVAPTYDELLAEGYTISTHDIGGEWSGMYSLGTPEDLARFLALPPEHFVRPPPCKRAP